MIPKAREVRLTSKVRKVLEARCRAPSTPQGDVKRARIVLLAAEGRSTRSIAQEVGVQPRIVSKWRRRFADHGLAGLEDRPRARKKPIYGGDEQRRILAFLDKPPPQGYARWTGPLLAQALGDVDVQYVWRFLREHNIDLAARKSWCESNDPEFAAKAADVVGLYIDPPAKAIVLCVDEKPSIQALERAQGYLKLPNGRALTGQSHDYKRHGTTTLFAALDVASGRIIAEHSKRRRRIEFLGFMNRLVAAFPDRQLHVILDNLNTHKKNERWLKRHSKVHFHFTPTGSSWLNQVEIWFSYIEVGEGIPLVCVHGTLGDFRVWSPVTGPPSQRHRVISISLRHFFPEHWDGVGTDYTIAQHVADVVGFIEAMGEGPVDLMGHSRGGHIAFRVAQQRPELLRRLVLAEPVGDIDGSAPGVSAPMMISVGTLIASASARVNGWRRSSAWPISVRALSRQVCRTGGGTRSQAPGPS